MGRMICSGDMAEWPRRFVGPYQSILAGNRGYHCGPCDDDVLWDEVAERHGYGKSMVPEYCDCDDTQHLHCPGCDHIVVRFRNCDELESGESFDEEEEN